MKKLLTFVILLGTMGFLEAAPVKKPKKNLTEEQRILLEEMETRIDEIKAMDFSSMSKEEIKEIKAEMKEMKKKADGHGIYISFGAIIIILLLLILLT
mgnify:CR=1 FL=1